MKVKVKTKVGVEESKVIGARAQCADCFWIKDAFVEYDSEKNIQELKNKIRSHVKETGHKVVLEIKKTVEKNVAYFI